MQRLLLDVKLRSTLAGGEELQCTVSARLLSLVKPGCGKSGRDHGSAKLFESSVSSTAHSARPKTPRALNEEPSAAFALREMIPGARMPPPSASYPTAGASGDAHAAVCDLALPARVMP